MDGLVNTIVANPRLLVTLVMLALGLSAFDLLILTMHSSDMQKISRVLRRIASRQYWGDLD